ncbi:hypothetical protein JW916_01535 [Candidatus Sumerlaeota bacterium]|nr:hypothetical protein [Candidatus Sumerlaeota bacterium]
MSSARRRRSLIPPKAQIPVMIVGAIVLVSILAWRLGDRKRSRPSASSSPTTASSAAAAPGGPTATTASQPGGASLSVSSTPTLAPNDTAAQLAELAELQSEILKEREAIDQAPAPALSDVAAAEPRVFKPVSRNPFLGRTAGLPDSLREEAARILNSALASPAGGGAPDTETLVEMPDSRESSSPSKPLVLLATYFIGNMSMAIVNGRVVRPGDEIEGLAVQSIRERELTLSNGWRSLVLRMEEIPGL